MCFKRKIAAISILLRIDHHDELLAERLCVVIVKKAGPVKQKTPSPSLRLRCRRERHRDATTKTAAD
jgi:hypothetical protein